ncbi:MAG: hypothetical protein COY74_00105, partial [Nitrosopumilales archaeon CG_4_10_14_0_8_um_filter_34_8]
YPKANRTNLHDSPYILRIIIFFDNFFAVFFVSNLILERYLNIIIIQSFHDVAKILIIILPNF